jgi:hypothetical protein
MYVPIPEDVNAMQFSIIGCNRFDMDNVGERRALSHQPLHHNLKPSIDRASILRKQIFRIANIWTSQFRLTLDHIKMIVREFFYYYRLNRFDRYSHCCRDTSCGGKYIKTAVRDNLQR